MFVGIDALLAVRPLTTFFDQFPCDVSVCQAASAVTSSYDDLIKLFESLENFLKRLEIYTKITPTPAMTEMVIKVMLELLSVFALATTQIKQGRFSECAIAYAVHCRVAQCVTAKFAKKLLFKEREIEVVLQRLDRLTRDEARAAIAQTFGAVHGLVGNMKVVMEGAQCLHDCSYILPSTG